MSTDERPRLYLIAPPAWDRDLPERLAPLLDGFDVACVRLALASGSEEEVGRACDALLPVCHARDVPLVVGDHYRLVERLGLDGVHLSDGARQVRTVRKLLAGDLIVGAFARTSRHDGMTAAEAGADYVAFGPAGATGLGDGSVAEPELFAWWSDMIEVPVVAEGALTPVLVGQLAPVTDFVALGPELWGADDPAAALRGFVERMA